MALTTAAAQARVVVFESEVSSRSLSEPLQIQLGSETVQPSQQRLDAVPAGERAEFVERLLRELPAAAEEPLLGLWLEASLEQPPALDVFVISLRGRPAPAQRLRFSLRPGGPFERALALTIAELYRQLQRGASGPPRPGPPPPSEPTAARRKRPARAHAELGAGQMLRSFGAHLSPLLAFEGLAGLSWASSPLRVRGHLGAYAQLPRSQTLPAGTISYVEQGALVGLGAWWMLEPLQPGALLELRALRFQARATAAEKRGGIERLESALALHAVVSAPISRRLRLDLSGGCAFQLRPARFIVLGETLAQVPRWAPEARLMLALTL